MFFDFVLFLFCTFFVLQTPKKSDDRRDVPIECKFTGNTHTNPHQVCNLDHWTTWTDYFLKDHLKKTICIWLARLTGHQLVDVSSFGGNRDTRRSYYWTNIVAPVSQASLSFLCACVFGALEYREVLGRSAVFFFRVSHGRSVISRHTCLTWSGVT